MIVTTTSSIEGYPAQEYKGIVASEVIIGANVFKDILGSLRDFFGGRSRTYEKVFLEARENGFQEIEQQARELGANAIIGVHIDYETVGQSNSMLMCVVTGTAVVI